MQDLSDMNRLPPRKFLLETFDYDPDTGVFKRKSNGHIYKLSKGNNRYIRVILRKVSYLVHRLAFYMATGKDPGQLQVDHIDRDFTNNRLSNLRLVDWNLQNMNRGNVRIIEFNGLSMTLTDWARKQGINARTIAARLDKGWSVSEALCRTPDPGNRVTPFLNA